MSWSINITGRVAEVNAKVGVELNAFRCGQPEASIKSEVGQVISLVLGNAPKDADVQVVASGNQTLVNPDRPGDGACNNVALNISFKAAG